MSYEAETGGIPISRFDEKTRLASSDVMLVSEYNPESDSLYYTDGVRAGRLGEMISAQFGVQDIKDAVRQASSDISAISFSVSVVSSELSSLSVAFLSNDALTRQIPALSCEVEGISADATNALRNERIIRHGRGRLGQYWLSAFAVNVCRPSGYSMIRLRLPPPIAGLSRHFTIDVSSDFGAIPVFYGKCDMYSSTPVPTYLSAGVEYFYDFKEISPDSFYVRTVVSPGTVTFDIEAVPNNAEWGTATGGGQYVDGQSVTLLAVPASV